MTISTVTMQPSVSVIKVSVPGIPGPEGRSVELTKSSTHIQWRRVGDATWIDLVALSDISSVSDGSGGSVNLSEYAKTVDVQNLINSRVPNTRTVSVGTGLTGGGDLSANRSIGLNFGTTAGTVTQGNDSRLSNTRTPTDASVTTAKLVDGAVTSGKIASSTIVNANISNSAAIAANKIAGLANVATTGDYADLINKPVITGGSGGTAVTQDPTNTDVLILDDGATATDDQIASAISTNNSASNTAVKNLIPSGSSGSIPDGSINTTKLADNSVTSSKIVDGTIVNSDISSTAGISTSKISGLSTVATTGSYNDLLNKPTSGSGGLDQAAVANAIATEGSEIRNALLALFGNVNWKLDSDGIPYFTSIGAGGTTPPPSSGNIATVDGAIVGTSVVGGSGSSGSSGTLNTVDNAVVGTALVG